MPNNAVLSSEKSNVPVKRGNGVNTWSKISVDSRRTVESVGDKFYKNRKEIGRYMHNRIVSSTEEFNLLGINQVANVLLPHKLK